MSAVAMLENMVSHCFHKVSTVLHRRSMPSCILASCVLLALVLSNYNDACRQLYHSFTETTLSFGLGSFYLEMPLREWVNECLMVSFFFLVTLEMKKEWISGHLSKKNTLTVIFAAVIGGTLVPASLFCLVNHHTPTANGWCIPIATDSAVAIGFLALFRDKIPASAITFFMTMTIIEDFTSLLILSSISPHTIHLSLMQYAIYLTLFGSLLSMMGIQHPLVYFSLGIGIWFYSFNAGVHPTIAGVLVGLTVPARSKLSCKTFTCLVTQLLNQYQDSLGDKPRSHQRAHDMDFKLTRAVKDQVKRATSPLHGWDSALQLPIALVVIPLCAFVNAGVDVHGFQGMLNSRLAMGIIFGLVLGKCFGVTLFAWLAQRLRFGKLPGDLTLSHLFGVSFFGGIGFTMSLFLSDALYGHAPKYLATAKVATIFSSILSLTLGFIWFQSQHYFSKSKVTPP